MQLLQNPDRRFIITQHVFGGIRIFERLAKPKIQDVDQFHDPALLDPYEYAEVEIHGDITTESRRDLEAFISGAKELTLFGCSSGFIDWIVPRSRRVVVLNLTCCNLSSSSDHRWEFPIICFNECISDGGACKTLSAPTITIQLPCDPNCYRDSLKECSLCFVKAEGIKQEIEAKDFSQTLTQMFGFHASGVSITFRNLSQLIAIDALNISISGEVRASNSRDSDIPSTACSYLDLRRLEFYDGWDLLLLLKGQQSLKSVGLPNCSLDEPLLQVLAALENLTELSAECCSNFRFPNYGPTIQSVKSLLISYGHKRRAKGLKAVFPNAEIAIL